MSASEHTALSVRQLLTKNGMTPMPHPPYSPDLALSNFFLLSPQMKKVLKGKLFADMEEVKQKRAEALKIDRFKHCFEQGKRNILIGVLHQMESTLKVTEV